MNSSIILINSSMLDVNQYADRSFAKVCEINQIEMLNNINKMPLNIIILMLVAFISLLCYLYIVPKLKDSWKANAKQAFVLLSIAALTFAIILQSAITFVITKKGWMLISRVFSVCMIIYLLYYIIYTHREN